jgi:hypothetical protein
MSTTSSGSQALAERMLTDAYEFVLSGWCQGAAALDECSRPIEPASAFARKWSALGALERARRRSPEPPGLALEAFQRGKLALTAAMNDVPQAWNDRPDRHQSEVLTALAEAVRLVDLPQAVPASAVEDVEDLDDVAPRWSLDREPFPARAAETPVEP